MATQTPNNRPRPARFNFMWIWAVILIGIIVASFMWDDDGAPVSSDLTTVKEMIKKGEVERVNVTGNRETIEVFLKEDAIKRYREGEDERYQHIPTQGNQLFFTHGSIEILNDEINLAEEAYRETLLAQDSTLTVVPYDVTVTYEETEGGWGSFFLNIFPWIFLIAIWFFFFRGMSRGGGGAGGIMNVGKARAQVFDKDQKKKVTFKDVAGLEEAKVEIMEIVDFLKKADKYRKLGAKIPKGALLVGPPGTGKTLLAKAVAGEANVPFLSISGSDFVEMFVGVGASRVRDLFEQAKQKAPCIVFIDEIDAIGRARGKNAGFSGNDERENTLNQLLTEMDGFQTNAGVIVLAATNRVDILDKALMRAGRFDRQIDVGLPDINERKDIFAVHLRNIKLDSAIDRHFLAKQTPGFSGADIANVCNEAALIAARKDKESVTQEDFLAAIDRIVGGLEKPNKSISRAERRATAIHEAGHATVMWLLPECDPVLKVTIIPRGRSLGATWSVPDEERVHITDVTLYERLAGMLAGRIAEEVNYGTLGAGALNDLERSTNMTYAMVAYYGMSKKIGPISFYDSTGARDTFTKPYSEQLAQEIDAEVRRILDEAYRKARQIVESHNEQINAMADLLMEKETIYADDIESILGRSAQSLKAEMRKQSEESSAEQGDVVSPVAEE
ncbi:MAG: ATP-dependent zinc metalloprotease FtsH [Rikenellaceae bacterium]|nr:ATP-dependent zinc metalloprotease FtsH [Rikenellaceae bacterium]